MTQTYDPDDVLMGGGNAPAWKFNDPGTTHTGIIRSKAVRQEREYDPNNPGSGAPKVFPSGDPIMGIVIEVATDERTHGDDDGKRTFYVEGQHLKAAVRDAVRTAGCQKLEIGGRLTVTFTHREDPMDKRSRKYWNVLYTPAADNALTQGQPPAAQQQLVQTPQGQVNPTTGELHEPFPYSPPRDVPIVVDRSGAPPLNNPPQEQPPAQQPAAAAAGQPDPAAIAALQAAGVDPRTVYPNWQG